MSDTFTAETLSDGLGECYAADATRLMRRAAISVIHVPVEAVEVPKSWE